MKAIVVRAFGGPEVLKVEDVPEPKAGPGQLVVKLRAIGVNPVETYVRSGQYPRLPAPPYTPGGDGAGTVESAGEGVALKPGARVFITGAVSGAYAEKALVLASRAFPLPDGFDFAQGAALGVPYGTAHRALFHHGGAAKGQSVLIHGASGGVGTAAVQLARAAGLTVIGTAGGPEGVAFIKEVGVHHALDHRASGYLDEAVKRTGGKGPDLIVEMLANKNVPEDLRVIAPRGRIVVVGNRGPVTVDLRLSMTKDARIQGMSLANLGDDERPVLYAAIGKGLADGSLKPIVSRRLPLADAAQAHVAVMEPGARGKIVLEP